MPDSRKKPKKSGNPPSISGIHLPQYEEIYLKVRNRIGRILKDKSRRSDYRRLALEIIDTANYIISSKLGNYREFYKAVRNNPQLHNYIREVYGEEALNALKKAAYLDSRVTSLWRTLRKHLSYLPLDGIVNEALNYVARLLSVVRRNRKLLERVLEIKKDVIKTPLMRPGVIPIVIVGPPNAGKSTLLNKLAGVDYLVADYPFTTKRAQASKRSMGALDALLIDTPGVINVEEPNIIERRALAFLKNPRAIILFMIDPSPEAPVDLSNQLKMLEKALQLNPNIIVAINKVDELDSSSVARLLETVRKEAGMDYGQVFAISALRGTNLDILINALEKKMVELASKTIG